MLKSNSNKLLGKFLATIAILVLFNLLFFNYNDFKLWKCDDESPLENKSTYKSEPSKLLALNDSVLG